MIHPKAIIEDGAVLSEGIEVGAYAVVEKGVEHPKQVVCCWLFK